MHRRSLLYILHTFVKRKTELFGVTQHFVYDDRLRKNVSPMIKTSHQIPSY